MSTPLLVLVCLIFPSRGPVDERTADRGPKGERVRQYTKTWTDDYGNYNKQVYRAYTKTLKDEQGEDVPVELWHGKATGFHKNGARSWEVEYRNGKREGEFTSWAENGTRTCSATMQHGELHGPFRQWASDGRKMREETYKKGKPHGEARWWDRDGNLLTVGTYRAGKPWAGTFIEYVTLRGDASYPVIRRYEDGKQASEKRLHGNGW